MKDTPQYQSRVFSFSYSDCRSLLRAPFRCSHMKVSKERLLISSSCASWSFKFWGQCRYLTCSLAKQKVCLPLYSHVWLSSHQSWNYLSLSQDQSKWSEGHIPCLASRLWDTQWTGSPRTSEEMDWLEWHHPCRLRLCWDQKWSKVVHQLSLSILELSLGPILQTSNHLALSITSLDAWTLEQSRVQ